MLVCTQPPVSLPGSSRTIWRGKKSQNKNFDDHTSEPFNSSINSEIDRRDDGDVRIARQISVETRAKISCGLVTPYWCWVPFWLSFPCDVISIWRRTNIPLQERPVLLVFTQYELRPWLPPCQSIPNVSARVWESLSCSQPGCIYQVGLYNEAKWAESLPWWAFWAKWVQHLIG